MDRTKWVYRKFKEVSTVIGGSTPKTDKSEYWGGSHYWVTPAELDGSKYISKTERSLTDKAVSETNLTLLPTGTVLLSSRAPIGKVCITQSPMYCNQGFKNIVCSDLLNNEFVYYYLLHNVDYLQSLGTGATFKEISKKVVENVEIIVPSLSDQHTIVAELDKLNDVIALKRKQLTDLDSLAQSLFYELFGDPVVNEKGWEVKNLEDVVADYCSISYGIVQPGNDVEGGIPVVRPVDLINPIVSKEGLKMVDKSISDAYKRTILKGNEILMCVRGTTGVMSLASKELEGCNVTRGITPLSFNDSICKYYALYFLKTDYTQNIIADKTRGIALKQINMTDVRLLPFIVPPLPLQQSFAAKIAKIEAEKQSVKSSLKDLETLLASRMQYWFDN